MTDGGSCSLSQSLENLVGGVSGFSAVALRHLY
jgi:hypothetical protein